MSLRGTFALSLLMLALAGCGDAPKGPEAVDQAAIENADKTPGDWLTYGRTFSEQRFSPLTKINKENVKELGLAWTFEFTTNRGQSATPLVSNGVMYVVSSWSVVHALDGATGKELWRYDPEVPRSFGAKACCDVTSRGLAMWKGKIFVAAFDGRLIALDAKSGKKVWETLTFDQSQPYTITGAPRVANGLIYIGNGGADLGVRGYVGAYDAETGKLVWRFYLVPGDPAKGPDNAASDDALPMMAKTWTGEWWKIGGGGTAWDSIVYDADYDQVLIGTGNGSPWNQLHRSPGGGDNLFLCAIVAVDAKTGKYKWHYQTTPGETWDHNSIQSIILADLPIGGKPTKVALHAPKNGFFYVLDRANGKLLSADPLIQMRAEKDTPPGQPISWAAGVDQDPKSPTFGRPIENPQARYKTAPALVTPAPPGARLWPSAAFNPAHGLVYFPVMNNVTLYEDDPNFAPVAAYYNTGAKFGAYPNDPKMQEAMKTMFTGALVAWDPVARKEKWRVNYDTMWNGGALATAGDLVFEGNAQGRFFAYDAATGAKLWETQANANIAAGPMTYEVNGEQYVAALSGYGGAFFLYIGAVLPPAGEIPNGRVLVYKLGGKETAPAIDLKPIPIPEPPAIKADAKTVDAGNAQFHAHGCFICHGFGGVSRSAVPDLRRSPILADKDAWLEVVHGGRLENGMPNFSKAVTAEQAEQMRAYIAARAATGYAEQQAAKPN